MDFKNYLPYNNITYLSPLSEAEITERLNYFVQPRRSFGQRLTGGGTGHKPYEGAITGNAFSISRVPGYRNSFLPDIEGSIHSTEKGTVIDTRLRLKSMVMVFMAYWIGAVGLTCLLVLGALVFTAKKAEPLMLVPFAMLAGGYALMYFGYTYESKIARAGLQKMFEAKII